jgi:hypothetical protein
VFRFHIVLGILPLDKTVLMSGFFLIRGMNHLTITQPACPLFGGLSSALERQTFKQRLFAKFLLFANANRRPDFAEGARYYFLKMLLIDRDNIRLLLAPIRKLDGCTSKSRTVESARIFVILFLASIHAS